MKALSLWQPWASLIAFGEKRVETRSWSTDYRGPIAIHASAKLARDQIELCHESPFCEYLSAHEIGTVRALPRGAIIAMAEISDCWHTGDGHLFKVPFPEHWKVGEDEKDFGDYSRNRYGIYLAKIRPLDQPVTVKGMLGLWEVPPEIAELVMAHLLPEVP